MSPPLQMTKEQSQSLMVQELCLSNLVFANFLKIFLLDFTCWERQSNLLWIFRILVVVVMSPFILFPCLVAVLLGQVFFFFFIFISFSHFLFQFFFIFPLLSLKRVIYLFFSFVNCSFCSSLFLSFFLFLTHCFFKVIIIVTQMV